MRWPDLASAEVAVSAALGVRVRLRLATAPAETAVLSAGEVAIVERLASGRRRRDWLLGRAALKALLEGADTSRVCFPSPSLSLTHAGGMAVAAQCTVGPAGLGVDFEGWRTTDPRTARFFLVDSENPHGPNPPTAAPAGLELLRLWTVKEALFKATADNVGSGVGLLDYVLDDASAVAGSARDRRGFIYRYVSGYLPQGPLSVAVAAAVATDATTVPVVPGGDSHVAA